jgi:crotonobetainyl-CoA:carnitine CoA-transferase CaiB-like acyl-CoA transferase
MTTTGGSPPPTGTGGSPPQAGPGGTPPQAGTGGSPPVAGSSDRPALTGLRVVDLSSGIAGGYCTKLLVDWGAEAVQVEGAEGDPLRRTTACGMELKEGDDSAVFRFLRRGQHSLVPVDRRAEIKELTTRAHVIIADSAEDTALVAEAREARPELILVSLSPFGTTGPWAGRAATDLTLQALSSSIAGRGEKTGRPVTAGGDLTEWAAGLGAAVAILIAMRELRRSGRGDFIDISKLEVAITIFNGFRAVSGQLAPVPPVPPRVVEVPSIEPAKDGWVGFCAMSADQFAAFAELIEAPEWAADPEIRRTDVRCARAEELRPRIAAWTTRRTVEEIVAQAGLRHIPTAPIGNGETGPSMTQFVERAVFRRDRNCEPRPPFSLSRTPRPDPGGSPKPGAMTFDTLRQRWPHLGAEVPDGRPGGPLAGVRVFDLTSFWAGPYASQVLGLFGAEVIKVESIQRPDGTRLGTSYGITGAQAWERAPLYQAVNTGKKNITLDLTTPRGRELGRALLDHCDVLIENYVPRVAERFGLLDDPRPDLIVVRMPAWGLTGPWRDRPGFAQTMEQASGLAWVTGFPDGPPLIPRGPCDPIGGLHAAFATMTAIVDRDRTGLGQVIEAPLIEAALNVAAQQFVEFAAYGRVVERYGNKSRVHAPHDVYRCRGFEQWVAISVTNDEQWRALRHGIGSPDWAMDPELETTAGRLAHESELDQRLGEWCAGHTPADIVDRLWQLGVPTADIVLPDQVLHLEQLRGRQFFEEVEHPIGGRFEVPAFPARFASRRVPYNQAPAPTLGQHNAEVLGGLLGLTDSELQRLEDQGIIGTAPSPR